MNPLAESEVRALDDEYRAWATHDQVIADFGDVPPFSNIRGSEARHVDALLALFARRGVLAPENPWRGSARKRAMRTSRATSTRWGDVREARR
jgi:hypothetical protein